MDDKDRLFWCNTCQRVLERTKITGLHKLAADVIRPQGQSRSLSEQVEELRCGYCGSGGLGYGELQEVANVPKLSLLVVLLGVGFFGQSIGSQFMQWIGFGIPAANAAYGLFLKSNIRWIFTWWVLVPEPDWYARKMEVFTSKFGFAFLHSNGGSLIAIVLLSIAGIAEATRDAKPTRPPATAEAPTTTAGVFRDERNGYFSIVPPKGWKVERADDARTKVTWRHPTNSDVLLRVIARAATESMDQVLRDTRAATAGWNRKGLKSVLTQPRLGDRSVVVVDQWPQSARSRLVLSVAEHVHFNVQYAAPSETAFGAHEAEAARAIETLIPLPRSTSSGTDAIRREDLAWYKRYALLLSKIGDVEASKTVAAEGSAKHPEDGELKRLAAGGR